ncbi:carbohydrate porin [Burkholderia sp. WAC0059]|uniref:carbohydrate porin n=1 Tax=Burkholderia sp. WAC0059 TaxID=2066022 RepID=UPI000C7EC03C|nr:carbohydrate porin [Burkholderia sp. WAC0059]PLZ00173.1 carbohydrate porin [Burkholderia sp. WAC0059]
MKNNLKNRLLIACGPLGLLMLLGPGMVPNAFAQASGDAASLAATANVAPAAPLPAAGATAASASAASAPASTGFWDRSNLLGDMGGLRTWLGNYGVTIGLQETGEYLSNLSGGTRRGGAYDGLTEFSLGVDTQKAFGLPGGTFNVSGLQIHGSNLSEQNLDTLQSASGLEADDATRLWELWYQQSLLGGKVDVKVGQQSLDQEFMASQNAGVFMNATFGWSALPTVDLPDGGPAYPLSSLGVRLRAMPSDAITVLAGVFDDSPAGSGAGDPQQLDPSGTNFNLHDGALVIGEVQYAINPAPSGSSGPQPTGLPGTYKLGFWYDSGRFTDPGFDSAGQSLANPAGTGVPGTYRGDYSVYAVADQMAWRPSADSPRSINLFARLMGAPGDRNLVDLGMNAGVTMKAPFAGRDNDVAGLAVGYAQIGSHAQDLASAEAAYDVPGYPSRGAETVVEATYQYQITPWWQLQGDAQYVFHPGGGLPDPDNPARRIGNELVLGVRTSVAF